MKTRISTFLAGVARYALGLIAFAAPQTASAQTNYQKLASFGTGGLTGSNTFGALIEAADGRLYSTTQFAGKI